MAKKKKESAEPVSEELKGMVSALNEMPTDVLDQLLRNLNAIEAYHKTHNSDGSLKKRTEEILTERLRLRLFKPDDAEAMFHAWTSDPEVARYVTWEPHASVSVTKGLLEMWIKAYDDDSTERFAIELKDTHELIGAIDVVRFVGEEENIPEIGYCLSSKHWGQGYMPEACKAFIEHLWSLGYPEVYIMAHEDNKRSNRVIEKAGFYFVERKTLQNVPKKGSCTVLCYRMKRPSLP